MHIAVDGLNAPLPPDWVAIQDSDNSYAFKNVKTGIIQQDHPLDEYFREQVIKERQQHEQQNSKQNQTKKGGISLLDQINAIQSNTKQQNNDMNNFVQNKQQKNNIQQNNNISGRDSPEINLDTLDNSNSSTKQYQQNDQINKDEIQNAIKQQNDQIQQMQQQYQNQIEQLKQTQQIQLQELQQTQKQMIEDITTQFKNQLGKVSEKLENQMNETQLLKNNQNQNQQQKEQNVKQKQMEETISNLQQQLNDLVVDKQKLQLQLNIMKQEQEQKPQIKYQDIESMSSQSQESQSNQLKTFEFILYLPAQIKQKFELKIQDLKAEQYELEQRKQQLKNISQKLQAERNGFNQMIDDPTLTTMKLKQIRKKLDEKSKYITKQIQKWQNDQQQFQSKQQWLLQLQDVLLSFCNKKNEIYEILSEQNQYQRKDIKKLISTADSDSMIKFINGMQWWQQIQQELQLSDFDQYENRQVPRWVDEFKKDLLD